jgi:hypothetical protein
VPLDDNHGGVDVLENVDVDQLVTIEEGSTPQTTTGTRG